MSRELFPCPVCGNPEFAEQGGYEICQVCGWEDDPVQFANPDCAGGANIRSLNQERELFRLGKGRPPKHPLSS